MAAKPTKKLSSKQQNELLSILKLRFEKNQHRHPGISWTQLETKLMKHPEKLWSLNEMEITGGEPDVIAFDLKQNVYTFCDCAAETPKERRSLCYDREAMDSRKEHRPKYNALDMAADMGVDLLNEEEYKALQQLEPFDTKTSSWLKTPDAIRKLGGALFGDCRYQHTFIYHNGASSYYAVRGFRGLLKI